MKGTTGLFILMGTSAASIIPPKGMNKVNPGLLAPSDLQKHPYANTEAGAQSAFLVTEGLPTGPGFPGKDIDLDKLNPERPGHVELPDFEKNGPYKDVESMPGHKEDGPAAPSFPGKLKETRRLIPGFIHRTDLRKYGPHEDAESIHLHESDTPAVPSSHGEDIDVNEFSPELTDLSDLEKHGPYEDAYGVSTLPEYVFDADIPGLAEELEKPGMKIAPRWPPTRFPCPALKCYPICWRAYENYDKGKKHREFGKCQAKCSRHCREPMLWGGDKVWKNLVKELEE